METITYTRTNKETEESTVLSFNDAVDQFIEDNLIYAEVDDITVEEAQNDMSTVFESQFILKSVEEDGIDAGHFIYTKNS